MLVHFYEVRRQIQECGYHDLVTFFGGQYLFFRDESGKDPGGLDR